MTNISRYSPNQPALAGDQFRRQPMRYSPTGRAITRSDKGTAVVAKEIANRGALRDFSNEVDHQVNMSEIVRQEREKREGMLSRMRVAQDTAHAAAAILDTVEVLSRGDAQRALEYQDIYQAWKSGEMYRMMTER